MKTVTVNDVHLDATFHPKFGTDTTKISGYFRDPVQAGDIIEQFNPNKTMALQFKAKSIHYWTDPSFMPYHMDVEVEYVGSREVVS